MYCFSDALHTHCGLSYVCGTCSLVPLSQPFQILEKFCVQYNLLWAQGSTILLVAGLKGWWSCRWFWPQTKPLVPLPTAPTCPVVSKIQFKLHN